ncbi:hypothetical protein [Novosphingobium sp.]|uniref:hypothetical protein n=1 Tax=Novosphingobium sp. TaxID=1874826 RepID=UPI003B517447
MTIHLNGHHRKTLASIFRHPASHNVEWHDVLSLLNCLGSVGERHGGGYEVRIGADRADLGRPRGKDLTGDELRHLSGFLMTAGHMPADLPDQAPAHTDDDHTAQRCIVLIDHQQAVLFRPDGEDGDTAPPRVLKPEDDDGSARRLEHRQGNDDHDGGHAAEEDSYYERIAVDLQTAQQIVVLSDGKGRSNAGDYLVGYLQRHYPAVAARIVVTDRVDISHLSDGEVVAKGIALLESGQSV